MKSLLLAAIFIVSGLAVKSQQVSLKKGQKIIVKQTSTTDMDMGMGMMMKSNQESASILEVTSENGNLFDVNNTMTAIKMDLEVMGQKKSFDSESKEVQDSSLGNLSALLNKPVRFTINKLSGDISMVDSLIGIKEDSNPITSMMQKGGQNETAVTDAVLIIDNNKKKAGTWAEKDSSKAGKSETKYTIIATIGNEVHIKYEKTASIINNMEQNGTQVIMNMTTKTKGEITSDIKTSLVKKKTSDSDISGTIEAMGQEMPVTLKVNQVSIYGLN